MVSHHFLLLRHYHRLGPSGAGLPQLPPYPPPVTSSSAPPSANKDVQTIKVFVGGIAPGIGDPTLKDLLNACGPLHELIRVVGANGKPQAFGFASFESPEVVLRCIRCLNGVELPDQTVSGPSEQRPRKALTVKADQKTAEFLQGFEETLGRSDSDESADAQARRSIAHIVAMLTDPNASSGGRPSKNRSGRYSPIQVIVPAHLQDLKEGDLPEAQRVAVLDQIAIFRENAARREREKKILDDEKEKQKAMQPQSSRSANSSYGYGQRAFIPPPANESSRTEAAARPTTQGRQDDPQRYNEPVNFVRPETAAGKGESERTDEEDEAIRKQKQDREHALALRDREHRVETRERQRIETALREESVRQQRTDAEVRGKRSALEHLADWDDDDVEERARDLFISDRAQWRAQRQQTRQREEQEDIDDRRLESDEIKSLEAESEDFLQKQMAELASLEARQRQAGLLADDAAPVKLAIAAQVVSEPKETKPAVAQVIPRPTIALGDEEDDASAQRKRRALVKLDYEKGLDEAEEVAKTRARLLDISKSLSRNASTIFDTPIEWSALQAPAVKTKIQGLIERKIADALGGLDQDLADFVVDHLTQHKGPRELVDDLSAVLADEAESFVVQIWRQLSFESRAHTEGLNTGSMLV
ncbi:hypothetical protein Q8F55_008824 [Vanrija albida]|uniref:PWI domain-containing protein n=1 Tax=Vanrija albida TaxID=181172 RepID=A0ABR3PRZ6_9TREE